MKFLALVTLIMATEIVPTAKRPRPPPSPQEFIRCHVMHSTYRPCSISKETMKTIFRPFIFSLGQSGTLCYGRGENLASSPCARKLHFDTALPFELKKFVLFPIEEDINKKLPVHVCPSEYEVICETARFGGHKTKFLYIDIDPNRPIDCGVTIMELETRINRPPEMKDGILRAIDGASNVGHRSKYIVPGTAYVYEAQFTSIQSHTDRANLIHIMSLAVDNQRLDQNRVVSYAVVKCINRSSLMVKFSIGDA
jgi:hypothetical protein